ncbi:hypothetical protein J3R83DRAFT_3213 [Lanmaoa asiatica]|nr:hypothetical protein J3R83DRAFT_3213 [Lanmaoa asiatica]
MSSSLPLTSNTLSSQQRSALVRSSKKLCKVLGDVPRVLDDDVLPTSTESTWRKRKPTHLPPLLKPSNASTDALDSPTSPGYHIPPAHRSSVLSIAPSILSNAPSTASASSTSDAPPSTAHQRAKLERLRRKLGNEVPATALFPTTPSTAVPRTPKTSIHTNTPRARRRSVAFSISSDESVHAVSFTAAHVRAPRAHGSKRLYQTGPLPPVPPIPAHLVSTSSSSSSSRREADDDAGLIRPRPKMAAGSKIGGSDFKAARRAKRAGRAQNGMAEPGELIEMVGFLF